MTSSGGPLTQSQYSGGRTRHISKFKASLVNRVSSKTARKKKKKKNLSFREKNQNNKQTWYLGSSLFIIVSCSDLLKYSIMACFAVFSAISSLYKKNLLFVPELEQKYIVVLWNEPKITSMSGKAEFC